MISRRIGAIIGITMAAFGLGGLILVLAETSRKQEEIETRLARILAETISVSFQSFDPRLGQHPVSDITLELAEREEIESLDVFDDHGRIRWSADPRKKGTIVASEVLSSILTSTRSAARPQQLEREDSHVSIVLPLRKRSSCLPCHAKSPDPIGGVHIVSAHHKLLGSSESFPRQAMASVFIFSILITFFLFFLINRVVVTRIEKLVHVMSRAEEGDFLVRAEVESNDEIGLLASTFNKMLAKITDLRVLHIDKEREMHRLKQLSFLYELGRDLTTQLELDVLLEKFGELVEKSLGVPELAVLFYDRAKSELAIAKARGFSRETQDSVELIIDADRGITGEAIKKRRMIYVPNVETDRREIPYRARRGTGSVLVVPVIYQDSLIGLLCFSSPAADAFHEEERELFGAVANQAALAFANAQLFQKTLDLSNTDGLTGILNRRAMENRLELEFSRALRDRSSLSALMIDIDHFKFYNDQHGHQLGDETLRRVARILERNIRKVDAVARYGGEEFCVILPRATKEEAIEVANKLRRSVEQADFLQGYMQPLGRVTISCGVASTPEDAENIAALITCADDALFRAKQGGRNQVVAYSSLRAPSFSRGEPPQNEPDEWNDDSPFN
jgi:diguanylate cyclase (GGDEF)-like protein